MDEKPYAPKGFDDYTVALLASDTITEREYIDFCLIGLALVEASWDSRIGVASRLSAPWLKYDNIKEDKLLGEIGGRFASLEIPDEHLEGGPESVVTLWREVLELVNKADQLLK